MIIMFLKPTQKKVVLFFLDSNQHQELEFTFT